MPVPSISEPLRMRMSSMSFLLVCRESGQLRECPEAQGIVEVEPFGKLKMSEREQAVDEGAARQKVDRASLEFACAGPGHGKANAGLFYLLVDDIQ